jgi:uncharacterized protein YwqG
MAIPSILAEHSAAFHATQQSFIRVRPQAARTTQPWDSKVGGLPYMPKGMDWPVAPDGRALFFLAQINFAEVPHLDPFPQSGIVQFYIYDDDLYGMDFDDGTTQDTFRVLWHPEPVKDPSLLRQDYDMKRDYDELPHHPEQSFPLQFALADELMPTTDYQFAAQIGADFFAQFGEDEWDIQEQYDKSVRSDGHKIGGYAYFLQDDPRSVADPMLLLFQLDSDEPMDLLWGDTGVGHFFIRPDDLAKRNFSRVLYDWDAM